MEACKFKIGDVLTLPEWKELDMGETEFEVSKYENGLIWFKGYEDQEGRKDYGYIVVRHNKSKTPHKHAELIKQWIEDTSLVVQFKDDYGQFVDHKYGPVQWLENVEYRIKPEPKPDDVKEVQIISNKPEEFSVLWFPKSPNAKFTFDGETRKLKSVELI